MWVNCLNWNGKYDFAFFDQIQYCTNYIAQLLFSVCYTEHQNIKENAIIVIGNSHFYCCLLWYLALDNSNLAPIWPSALSFVRVLFPKRLNIYHTKRENMFWVLRVARIVCNIFGRNISLLNLNMKPQHLIKELGPENIIKAEVCKIHCKYIISF